MKILYIAYSCDPYNGSEDKIGWNVPFESEKMGNEVYVITKEEQKKSIEKYCEENDYKKIHFYYADINQIYKKIFKGPFYSGRLNIWNKEVLPIARKICEDNSIDIIHQITPIEFRAIGDYGKIKNIKFVVGPLGGGENIPKPLKKYANGHRLIEYIRLYINHLYVLKYKFTKKIRNIDYLMFANKETKEFFKRIYKDLPNSELYLEFGLTDKELDTRQNGSSTKKARTKTRILLAGRLQYRKGHIFLFNVLTKIKELNNIEIVVVGSGPEEKKLHKYITKHNLNNIVKFKGKIDYTQMGKEYELSDILIMPSLRETSGNVMLEALSKEVPVIAMNCFGAKLLLDNSCAFLYDSSNPEEGLTKIINKITFEQEDIDKKRKNTIRVAELYRWSNRVKHYNNIYIELLRNRRC